MSIKLSILVPTVPSRLDTFYMRIMKQLINQTKERNDVEVISLFDNKKRTIGEKRNNLLDIARGDYLVFIDDDDRISDNYVNEILNSIYTNPNTDCIVFNSITSIDNGPPILCKYGIEFEYGYISTDQWRGKPAHTMVYKSSIAKRHKFPIINNGEDVDWVKRACMEIKHQTRIENTLYWYDANYKTTSETSGIPSHIIEQNIINLFSKHS